MNDALPAGFNAYLHKSPVTDAWQPIYVQEQDGVVALGIRVGTQHCNARGFLHGGVIAALADNAMGFSYMATLLRSDPEASASAVTLSLSLDYAAIARAGAWLHIRPRVLKAGRSIGFVEALILADEKVVARASATFKRIGAAG
jgi:uncharacterized protein (TIGR00369 family)